MHNAEGYSLKKSIRSSNVREVVSQTFTDLVKAPFCRC
jgi:hypothetical protein